MTEHQGIVNKKSKELNYTMGEGKLFTPSKNSLIDQITPLILTYNEAPNIRRTLDTLYWAKQIIILDSGSTDNTLNILKSYANIRLEIKKFTDFKTQWNHGISYVSTEWILTLDADYEPSCELILELHSMVPEPRIAGYRAEFVYRIFGRTLRGALYPPRVVLFRKGAASYRQEGHTQQLEIFGEVLPLRGKIYHDDRKPLSRWITSQQRYALEEAEYILTRRVDELSSIDWLRRMGWLAPIAVFFYVLFIKRCIFDGWPGWYYALQRVIAEALLALELTDRRIRRSMTWLEGERDDS